jgi:hypothetical protein
LTSASTTLTAPTATRAVAFTGTIAWIQGRATVEEGLRVDNAISAEAKAGRELVTASQG